MSRSAARSPARTSCDSCQRTPNTNSSTCEASPNKLKAKTGSPVRFSSIIDSKRLGMLYHERDHHRDLAGGSRPIRKSRKLRFIVICVRVTSEESACFARNPRVGRTSVEDHLKGLPQTLMDRTTVHSIGYSDRIAANAGRALHRNRDTRLLHWRKSGEPPSSSLAHDQCQHWRMPKEWRQLTPLAPRSKNKLDLPRRIL